MMEIKIIRKNIKNIIIKVEDGIILVSAPKSVSNKKIDDLISLNEFKILEMIKKDIEKHRYDNCLLGKTLETKYEQKALDKLYKDTLERILPNIFEKYGNMTGLFAKEYRIRKMKNRWATCYHYRKLIIINLYLARRPIEEIEATVLHEIIHLKHNNHKKEFYKDLEYYMPQYKKIERDLKR